MGKGRGWLYSSDELKQAEIDWTWEVHTRSNTLPIIGYADWREKHLSSQKMLCAYCSIKLTKTRVEGVEDRQATVDHVIPLANGGPDKFENTVAACAYCNFHKADLSVEVFKAGKTFYDRIKEVCVGPNQLSNDPKNPYYDGDALERGIGVQFNGKERLDVYEYSMPESWIKIPAGKSVDRRGNQMLIKLKGHVFAYYFDNSEVFRIQAHSNPITDESCET